MEQFDRQSIALALSLSCMAGYIDTLGFLQMGGYFVSFMSGNSTRLSIAMVSTDWLHARMIAGIIALFVLGAFSGTFIRHFCSDAKKILGVLTWTTLLIFMAASANTSGNTAIAVGFMIISMGAVNAVFEREGNVAIGLTYMTGTLVKVGQRAAQATLGGKRFAWAPYLLLWTSLITGGAVGVVLYYRFSLHSLWLAVLWASLLCAIVLRDSYAHPQQK